MRFAEEAFASLARRMSGNRMASQEELEALFVPMIRVAMRTGAGQPALVDWVTRNLAAVKDRMVYQDKSDLEWAVPRMARLLCSQLLQTAQTERCWAGEGETVVGR